MAADTAGNLYVLDAGNNALRRITPDGFINTIAKGEMSDSDEEGGSGPLTPTAGGGVAVDAAGDIFISQYIGDTVTEVTSSFMPYLDASSARNGALQRTGPGSLISLLGFNLASGVASAGSGSLPTTLLDTSVTIDGVAAPLLYVSPMQVNLQIPFETSPGQATIEILRTSEGMASS